jgi:hypothetical protein
VLRTYFIFYRPIATAFCYSSTTFSLFALNSLSSFPFSIYNALIFNTRTSSSNRSTYRC